MNSLALIRPIVQHELPDLLALYEYFTPDNAVSSEAVAAVWAQICADDKLYYFGAEVEGNLVSTCNLTLIPNLTHQGRPYGLIENVITHPDYRKRGLASQVLDAALKTAWAQNCYKVMLLTGSKLESTLQFYENAGFTRRDKTGFVARPNE